MGVVQLDRHVVGQCVPVGVPTPEAADEVGQRAGDEEVLLHEAEPLPHRRRIVRIEDAGQRLGPEALGQRADEVAVAELLEVEIVPGPRRPEPERVDRLPAIADDGTVERHADQRRRSPGDRLERAGTDFERTIEGDLDAFVGPRHLPRVRATQPVVRLLPLPAVLDRLPEHPVLVAEPVAHGGQLHGRHRVEEAGREPPEAAVAEPGVGLLLDEPEPVEPFLRHDLPGDRVEQQVHDVVRERAADQELHRQVVDALRVLALVRLLGADPPLRQDVPHRARARLEAFARPSGSGIADAVEEQMALIEPIGGARELDGAAAILREQVRRRGRVARRQIGRTAHMLVPVLRGLLSLVAITLLRHVSAQLIPARGAS